MDSAGPILRAGGRTGYPDGAALSLARDRTLNVAGGWRDRRGRWLRHARFRFTAISRGVRVSFPVRRGDRVTYAVFAEQPRASAGGIIDERARTSFPPPVRRTFTAGFTSSDSSRLTRAALITTVRRATRLAIVVRSTTACGRPL